MANHFGIPLDIEEAIRKRDIVCAYCGGKMNDHLGVKGSPKDKATIEHLNFDGPFYWSEGLKAEDIVICCQSCNSSRGVKKLSDWFSCNFCKERNINENTVSQPVKDYLVRNLSKNYNVD
jgi:hypothetical protein